MGQKGKHHDDEHAPEDFLTKVYRKVMTPLLRSWKVRTVFFIAIIALLLGAMSLVGTKQVTVKMLPFDNKNEFQVIVDMPAGTTLEQTAAVARTLADYSAKIPEVTDYQIYVGTASPFNFNGLVRHYFMRGTSYQADLQINLVGKGERKAQSHAIVKRIRDDMTRIAKGLGARIKIAEVPPGPPVLQTLVAEVYGPDEATRTKVASQVKHIFETTEGVSDVDWYMDDDQQTIQYVADKEKAALVGVDVATINRTLTTSLSGSAVGLLHDEGERESIPISVRLGKSSRSDSIRSSLPRPKERRFLCPNWCSRSKSPPTSRSTIRTCFRSSMSPAMSLANKRARSTPFSR
jgi:multidrug efflux pump subunit AcrB